MGPRRDLAAISGSNRVACYLSWPHRRGPYTRHWVLPCGFRLAARRTASSTHIHNQIARMSTCGCCAIHRDRPGRKPRSAAGRRDVRPVTVRGALTETGNVLAAAVPDLLADWDVALRETKATASQAARVLRVGFIASAPDKTTQQIIASCARRRPGWRVDWQQAAWSEPTGGALPAAMPMPHCCACRSPAGMRLTARCCSPSRGWKRCRNPAGSQRADRLRRPGR